MNRNKLSALILTAVMAVGVFTGCQRSTHQAEETQTTSNSEVAEKRYEWSINDIKDNFYIDGEKVEFPIPTKFFTDRGLTVRDAWYASTDIDNGRYYDTMVYRDDTAIAILSVFLDSDEYEIKSDYATEILVQNGEEYFESLNISVCGISLDTPVEELKKYTFSDCEFTVDDFAYMWKSDDKLLLVMYNEDVITEIEIEVK